AGLENHPNFEFKTWILNSLERGFNIEYSGVDKDLCKTQINLPMTPIQRVKFFEKFIEEIELGRIQPVETKPKYICPLGVVWKNVEAQTVRIIRHLSFSDYSGKSINEQIPDMKKAVKLPSMKDICEMILKEGKGCYGFALDLKSAFRQLFLRDEDTDYLGYRWENIYFKDLRVADGLATAPKMCQGFGEALIAVVEELYLPEDCRGKLVIYIDDIIGIHCDKNKADLIMFSLQEACKDLRVVLNNGKMKKPSQKITLLGISFDTNNLTCGIDEKKLKKYKKWIDDATQMKIITKNELEKGIGYLNWVAQLMFPGKAFLRRLRNVLSNLEGSNDYCQVTPEMKKDFFFWNKYLEHAKDVALYDILKIHTYKYIIESDASTGYGLGAFMPPKYIMLPTPTEFKGKNIAVLEILAITLAISTFLGE
ncbi:MAG: hypothetical protein GY714_30810, partial [Desulfobacterales bacterium]|nr:hypothetical protein [Desulfobacterales bacterium]